MRVTNTVDNPVPVSAAQSGSWNVGINGTPNVAIAGTPAVSLAGTPTVNVGNFPAATAPPLWQGTPYVKRAETGCFLDFDIPAGMVLFLERVVTFVSNSPGSAGRPQVSLTPLGGSATGIVPDLSAGPASQFSETFSGVTELGIPVTAISACVHGLESVTIIWYLVPAPPAP